MHTFLIKLLILQMLVVSCCCSFWSCTAGCVLLLLILVLMVMHVHIIFVLFGLKLCNGLFKICILMIVPTTLLSFVFLFIGLLDVNLYLKLWSLCGLVLFVFLFCLNLYGLKSYNLEIEITINYFYNSKIVFCMTFILKIARSEARVQH